LRQIGLRGELLEAKNHNQKRTLGFTHSSSKEPIHMNFNARRLGNGGLFVLIAATAWSANAEVYSAIELDTLGGIETRASDINSAGQVVGSSELSFSVHHAVRWDGATATDLGTLGGDVSYATGINDSGQVVGTSHTTSADHPVLWNGTTPTDLTDLRAPDTFRPFGINDAGQILGGSFLFSAYGSPGIWDGTTFTDLGGGFSAASDINNAGQVVGQTRLSPHAVNTQAALWNGTTLTDLGSLTGHRSSTATGINDAGQIVGCAGPDPYNYHAFLWSGATATDLGPPLEGSCASDINNAGQIVGNTEHGPALWNGTTRVDLNSAISAAVTSKVSLGAVAINDDGWIAANAVPIGGGRPRAYLLVPLTLAVSPRTLSFGSQGLGSTSSPLTINLTHTGASPFTVGGLPTTGEFSETDNCGGTLGGGASCAIQVTFHPTVPGEQTGELTIGSGLKTYVIPLAGTGTFGVTLTASASNVTVGAPFTLTWSSPPGSTCTPFSGSPGDGWTGTFEATGSLQIIEDAVGTHDYGISCTLGGVTESSPGVSVAVTLPTVTLSATPTNVTVGQSVSLTWSSADAASCVANGGQAGDGWAGNKATNGTISVPALSAATITYTIVCSSGPQSAQALVQVIATGGGSGGGGGGSFDLLSLALILAILMFGRNPPTTTAKQRGTLALRTTPSATHASHNAC
jgi:probable HAF family extracellular repeat protein